MFHSPLQPFATKPGMSCPYCGGATLSPSLRDLCRMVFLFEEEQIALEEMLAAAADPKKDAKATLTAISAALFEEDAGGGPDESSMRYKARKTVKKLQTKLAPFPLKVSVHLGQNERFLGASIKTIADPSMPRLRPAFLGKSAGFQRNRYNPLPCPCCSATIQTPNEEQVFHYAGLQPQERAVIRAIFESPHRVATTERIAEIVYGDRNRRDTVKSMLSYGRSKLVGTGMTVVSEGYRGNYRVVEEIRQ